MIEFIHDKCLNLYIKVVLSATEEDAQIKGENVIGSF